MKYIKNNIYGNALVLRPNQTNIKKVDDINVLENPTININMTNDTNDSLTLNNAIKVLVDGKTEFILSGYTQGIYSISGTYIGDGKYNSAANFTSFNLTKVNNVNSEISSNDVLSYCQKILLVM